VINYVHTWRHGSNGFYPCGPYLVGAGESFVKNVNQNFPTPNFLLAIYTLNKTPLRKGKKLKEGLEFKNWGKLERCPFFLYLELKIPIFHKFEGKIKISRKRKLLCPKFTAVRILSKNCNLHASVTYTI